MKVQDILRAKIARLASEQLALQDQLLSVPAAKIEAHIARMDELARELSKLAAQLPDTDQNFNSQSEIPNSKLDVRVAVRPFPGSLAFIIHVPPILAALRCAGQGCTHHIPQIAPTGERTTVWISLPGMTCPQKIAWINDHPAEFTTAARAALVTPRNLN